MRMSRRLLFLAYSKWNSQVKEFKRFSCIAGRIVYKWRHTQTSQAWATWMEQVFESKRRAALAAELKTHKEEHTSMSNEVQVLTTRLQVAKVTIADLELKLEEASGQQQLNRTEMELFHNTTAAIKAAHKEEIESAHGLILTLEEQLADAKHALQQKEMDVSELKSKNFEIDAAQRECNNLRDELAETERALQAKERELLDSRTEGVELKASEVRLESQIRGTAGKMQSQIDSMRLKLQETEACCVKLRVEVEQARADAGEKAEDLHRARQQLQQSMDWLHHILEEVSGEQQHSPSIGNTSWNGGNEDLPISYAAANLPSDMSPGASIQMVSSVGQQTLSGVKELQRELTRVRRERWAESEEKVLLNERVQGELQRMRQTSDAAASSLKIELRRVQDAHDRKVRV